MFGPLISTQSLDLAIISRSHWPSLSLPLVSNVFFFRAKSGNKLPTQVARSHVLWWRERVFAQTPTRRGRTSTCAVMCTTLRSRLHLQSAFPFLESCWSRRRISPASGWKKKINERREQYALFSCARARTSRGAFTYSNLRGRGSIGVYIYIYMKYRIPRAT